MQTTVKNLHSNTRIFLEDGTSRPVSEIKKDDELAAFGEELEIFHIENRKENAYKVNPVTGFGKPYIVGEEQILTLAIKKNSIRDVLKRLNGFNTLHFDPDDNFIVYISVQDYMKLPNCLKNELYGFRNPDPIGFEKTDQVIDAYTIGYWISRGKPDSIQVDEFVAIYQFEKDVKHGIFTRELDQGSFVYTPTEKFNNAVKEFPDEGIPELYLKAGEDQIWAFLCGFSEGCPVKKEKGLMIDSRKMVEDLVFLIRSLGCGVKVTDNSGWVTGVYFVVEPILDDQTYMDQPEGNNFIDQFEISEMPTIYPVTVTEAGEQDITRIAFAGSGSILLEDFTIL